MAIGKLGFSLETAMEITAEGADYAENADEVGFRWRAMREDAFTH